MGKFKKFLGIVALMALLVVSVIGVSVTTLAEEFESGYNWTSNNASGTIAQKADGVWLSAKAATTGDIYDYTYNNPVNVADVNIIYTIKSDTTRGNGAHSRYQFYILPEKNSAISEGVTIEMINSAFNTEYEMVVGSGPVGGWDKYAYLTEDFTANLRLYAEGENFFLNVNGARYIFNGNNLALLKQMQQAGKAYIRTTAHFADNGSSAFGADVCIHSIDDIGFGAIKDYTLYRSKKDQSTAAGATAVVENGGITMTGKFNPGVGTLIKSGIAEIEAGELSGFSIAMDLEMNRDVQKYIDISFTNILRNTDRLDAWDSYGDAAGQPTIFVATFRIYTSQAKVLAIVKDVVGGTGAFAVLEPTTYVANDPYYEFDSFIDRADGVRTFQLAKVGAEWKVFVNGASIGAYPERLDTLLNTLDTNKVAVAVAIGSDNAANAYNGNAPVEKITIKSINGAGRLPHEHVYGETTYKWNEENTVCTATRVCAKDKNHVETVNATVTTEIEAATCTEAGEGVYTATFTEAWATTQIKTVEIPAINHAYGEVAYEWNAENTACTATTVCANDANHVKTATATVTSVTTPTSCAAAGETVYTATFVEDWATTQTKTVEIPKENHAYGEVTYTWNAENTACTATRVCGNDDTHVETANATVTFVTTDATCVDAGDVVFTATFEEDWAATQIKTVVMLATDHAYGEVTYTWNAENTVCTATRVCGNDETHVETANATVTSEVTEESTCAVAGEIVYTATFAEAWATTQTKVEKLPKEEHTFGEWEILKKATIKEEGLQTHTCQECGATEEEVIPKIEFNSEEAISCGGAMGGTTAAFVAVMGMATLAIRRKRR